jgi:hypothetical protein
VSAQLLHPEFAQLVEAVAQRVVELLDERDERARFSGLVDAQAIADLLDVDRGWVYRHAVELGAVRLGGETGRLRFDAEAAKAAVARSAGERSDIESACSDPEPEPIRGRSGRSLPSHLPPAGSVLSVRGGS